MEEQGNGQVKKLISAIIAGIALGLLMTAVVLLVMRAANYPARGVMLLIMVVIGCAFPACADLLGIRLDLN
ncbi:MAG: hypothetical protein EOM64_05845, partial [Erysipelotrichia bacterium]|nr:hypothetical protein [Erysipelotrichia bacterium]